MRQPFSGTAERIFIKLLSNDSGENGVSNAVPKLGLGSPNNFVGIKTTQCALLHVGTGADAWRITQNKLVYAGSVLYGGCVKKA